MTDQPLVLASASPGRAMIFRRLGLPFEAVPSTVDEPAVPEPVPSRRAQLLARLKAEDVAKGRPDRIVIGCDSVVETASEMLLEKPVDAADARRMLQLLSGKAADCHSGMCVVGNGKMAMGLCTTRVTFAELSPEMIDWWIGQGGWEGCAGAFQIEGRCQLLISQIEGDFTSVVGLPVFLLGKLLREVGYPLWDAVAWPKS
jgi:septum formation protein